MSTPTPSSSSHPLPDDFERFLPHLTTLLDNLTTQSASLPLKSDLAFHKTLDRKFGKGLDQSAEQVLALTGKLLQLSASSSSAKGKGKAKIGSGSLGEDDLMDRYKRVVVEVVDGLLEDADSRLDGLSGRKKKAAIDIPQTAIAAASQKLPGPVHAKYPNGLLPSHLRNDTTIPKPQLHFSDPPNNSPNLPPWTPTLHTKPHAMVPLNWEPPISDLDVDVSDGETDRTRAAKAKARRHPYWYETRHLPYPTAMFTSAPTIAPASFENTPFTFVDTPEALDELEENLKGASEVAVDLEHHDMRSYHGFTCLIQISTREGDWIVDALELRKEIRERKFGDVFSDPNVVKVFHGADSDIIWLQQDFDIYIVNLFDTYHATVVLGMNSHSLAGLLSLYCNFTADKRYQMADWRIRPLSPEMLHYARADTHFLLFIYDNLRNALLEKSSRPPSPVPHGADEEADNQGRKQNPQEAMRRVLKRSAETATRMYEREEYRPLNPDTVGKRWLAKKEALGEVGWVFAKIHAWRDGVAREEDESPFYIMPNLVLANLSRLEHPSIPLIRKVTSAKAAPAAAKAEHLHRIIMEAKAAWKDGPPAEWTPPTPRARSPFIRSPPPTSTTALRSAFSSTSLVAETGANAGQAQPNRVVVNDLWTQPPLPPASKASGSKLFGRAVSAKSKPVTNEAKTIQAGSSLFGHALAKRTGPQANGTRRAKSKSPGFENIMAGIHATLAPPPPAIAPPAAPTTDAPENANGTFSMPEPETVPFVPASSRTTLPAAESAQSQSAPAPSVPIPAAEVKAKKKNEIVEVRRKKSKKRDRDASATGLPPSSISLDTTPANVGSESPAKKSRVTPPTTSDPNPIANATVEADGPAKSKEKKGKKEKKKRIDPADIPVFDYSTAPNLLDNPAAVAREQEGKGKKRKDKKKKEGVLPSQPTTIEVPRFGSFAPKDMTAPKGGNRSGTFNH